MSIGTLCIIGVNILTFSSLCVCFSFTLIETHTARLQFQNYLLIFAAATFEGLFCMVKTFLSMINRLILCFTLLFSTTYGIKAINVRDCGAIVVGKIIDSSYIKSNIYFKRARVCVNGSFFTFS